LRDEPGPRTLAELAAVIGGEVRGDADLVIRGVNGLAEARAGDIAFYNNARYREALKATLASAVLLEPTSLPLLEGKEGKEGKAAIVVADPYLAFARVSTVFHPRPRFAPGIDPRAVVEAGAQVDPGATVMAFAYVGRLAKVGAGAVLFPQVFVGEQSEVGPGALLYPGVVVRERCRVGEGAILQPGVVIGGDGFGFAFDAAGMSHFKIPQAGTVEVEPDVEIGSNSAIDRATLGATRIGRGVKIDNLVQVGHNVQVGPLAILCGQVGIAGSAVIGAGAVLGGQAGVANHVKVGSRVRLAAQSGVMGDLDEGREYMGSPTQELREFLRTHAAVKKVPETNRRVRTLERKVEELESKLAALLSKSK
jgi:UDP-3-O-[3-hydroxymyristoyl] glucosamine N-acyltransferase